MELYATLLGEETEVELYATVLGVVVLRVVAIVLGVEATEFCKEM